MSDNRLLFLEINFFLTEDSTYVLHFNLPHLNKDFFIESRDNIIENFSGLQTFLSSSPYPDPTGRKSGRLNETILLGLILSGEATDSLISSFPLNWIKEACRNIISDSNVLLDYLVVSCCLYKLSLYDNDGELVSHSGVRGGVTIPGVRIWDLLFVSEAMGSLKVSRDCLLKLPSLYIISNPLSNQNEKPFLKPSVKEKIPEYYQEFVEKLVWDFLFKNGYFNLSTLPSSTSSPNAETSFYPSPFSISNTNLNISNNSSSFMTPVSISSNIMNSPQYSFPDTISNRYSNSNQHLHHHQSDYSNNNIYTQDIHKPFSNTLDLNNYASTKKIQAVNHIDNVSNQNSIQTDSKYNNISFENSSSKLYNSPSTQNKSRNDTPLKIDDILTSEQDDLATIDSWAVPESNRFSTSASQFLSSLNNVPPSSEEEKINHSVLRNDQIKSNEISSNNPSPFHQSINVQSPNFFHTYPKPARQQFFLPNRSDSPIFSQIKNESEIEKLSNSLENNISDHLDGIEIDADPSHSEEHNLKDEIFTIDELKNSSQKESKSKLFAPKKIPSASTNFSFSAPLPIRKNKEIKIIQEPPRKSLTREDLILSREIALLRVREAKYKQNFELMKKEQEIKIRKENLLELASQTSFLRQNSIRCKSVPRLLSNSNLSNSNSSSNSVDFEKNEKNEAARIRALQRIKEKKIEAEFQKKKKELQDKEEKNKKWEARDERLKKFIMKQQEREQQILNSPELTPLKESFNPNKENDNSMLPPTPLSTKKIDIDMTPELRDKVPVPIKMKQDLVLLKSKINSPYNSPLKNRGPKFSPEALAAVGLTSINNLNTTYDSIPPPPPPPPLSPDHISPSHDFLSLSNLSHNKLIPPLNGTDPTLIQLVKKQQESKALSNSRHKKNEKLTHKKVSIPTTECRKLELKIIKSWNLIDNTNLDGLLPSTFVVVSLPHGIWMEDYVSKSKIQEFRTEIVPGNRNQSFYGLRANLLANFPLPVNSYSITFELFNHYPYKSSEERECDLSDELVGRCETDVNHLLSHSSFSNSPITLYLSPIGCLQVMLEEI